MVFSIEAFFESVIEFRDFNQVCNILCVFASSALFLFHILLQRYNSIITSIQTIIEFLSDRKKE